MFKINNIEIKNKRDLTDFLQKNKTIDFHSVQLSDIDSFCDLLDLDKTLSYSNIIDTLKLLAKINKFLTDNGIHL